MKKIPFLLIVMLLSAGTLVAQVGINTDGTAPDPSAILDVNSTDKGTLITRLTQTQIEAIMSPANGLVVFCTTDDKFYTFVQNANEWKEIAYGAGSITPPCGTPIIINHVAGTIAPVNKTVTYGTVTNIPGETSKCWITSNLGADHQATAVNDNTEASAGWYWQFNRKQGYKHDGATVTPSWTITSINEDLDWEAANDPCTLELGSGWRIPTLTEWTNVDASGGWSNWNGPWNSGLKMHAAGLVYSTDGSLINRGVSGYYWSSTQDNTTTGFSLRFHSTYCGIPNYIKAHGFSLRCLRE